MMILLFYLFSHFHAVTSLGEELPKANVYAFGDSNFEIGRKENDHASWMKAGYLPYGSTCMFLDSKRFSDGKTIPELIVESLKFKGLNSIDDIYMTPDLIGANFASASAGILPETGTMFGKNLCFKEQIRVFKEYAQKDLKGRYQTEEALSKYLAKSIFLINIGASDYIHNYLQPNYYNTSNLYNGDEFADLLVKQYGDYLKELHKLGARKMVIFQIGPLGCFPFVIEKLKPTSRCAENVNDLVSKFNSKLDAKLKELGNELDRSQFVTARIFPLMKDMIETPSKYGFEETRWPCCNTVNNGTGLCKETVIKLVKDPSPPPDYEEWAMQNAMVCKDLPMPESLKKTRKWTGPNVDRDCIYRRVYIFFDELHLTTAVNEIILEQCLGSTSGTCSPVGIYGLSW